MITATGAPFNQGRQQGEARLALIHQALEKMRARYTRLSWLAALRSIHRGPGRAMLCFLPQQHERLQGIARGADVWLTFLELFEALHRVAAVGTAKGTKLDGSFEIPAELEYLLILRHSLPDAGGFPSVELSCAPWAGCLAGVNDEGIGAVCLEDQGRAGPPLRLLTQDVLFRVREFGSALDHLRRRATYVGASGKLLVADSTGCVARVELIGGVARIHEGEGAGALAQDPMVRIDCVDRTLTWRRVDGTEQVVRPTPPPT